MNLFEQYGIKEVADVTIYSIHKKEDGSGELFYVPALYLDTLKVSTVEKTADNTWAQGGLGNARLINWDFDKQINVTLEDALCTPASLGLCWNGILSANWKNAHIQYNSDVCCCQNPVTRLSRMEKATYPRADRGQGLISNLLPKLSTDVIDDGFGVLKISSVVDGTDIRGFGTVRNKTYRWKMAIESAIQSIAVIPDRFFDIKGNQYSIDWNRKVSVHSLTDYENYKDAIIYRINTRNKCIVPPLAKIIYDNEMQTKGKLITLDLTTIRPRTIAVVNPDITETLITKEIRSYLTLAEILEDNGYTIYEEGIIKKDNIYYIPQSNLSKNVIGIRDISVTGKISVMYETEETFLEIDENSNLLPAHLTEVTGNSFGGTLVSYLQNHAFTDLLPEDKYGTINSIDGTCDIKDGHYLAIIVDNNDNYIPLIGKITNYLSSETEDTIAQKTVLWYKPSIDINVTQFKGIDMWLRFSSINEMIYFLITKYNDDIISISAATLETNTEWDVNKDTTLVRKNFNNEAEKVEGKLWAYINPHTMQPYSDDYWFHQGENYYIKSLTIAPKGKQIKGNKIIVKADEWPGMYMVIGETYIRSRDTGKDDQRMQIKIPFCKVKSDHTLTLEAGGEPTVFNLDLEVAKPASGNLIEITAYEIAAKMIERENGCYYAIDGSTEVLSE